MAKAPAKSITVAPPPPTIELVNASGKVDDIVYFGLFDGAFEYVAGIAELLNSDTDETRNFVGSDSRRFYFRVTDPSRALKTATSKRRISAEWYCLAEDGKTRMFSGNVKITMEESAPGSGIFVSNWLLLSSDPWEVGAPGGAPNVPTTSGFSGDPKLRKLGDDDYRLRLASLFGTTVLSYPGAAEYVVGVFHAPGREERLKMPVEILVVDGAVPAGASAGTTDAVIAKALGLDLDNLRIVYARLGIWPFTAIDKSKSSMPGAREVVSPTNPADSLLVITALKGVPIDPIVDTVPSGYSAYNAAYLGLTADGTVASSRSGMSTVQLFYVTSLNSVDSKGTRQLVYGLTTDGGSFTYVNGTPGAYFAGSSAHEIGHTLCSYPGLPSTDPDAAHYKEPVPAGRYLRLCNLMCNGSFRTSNGVGSPQRLWDANDGWTPLPGGGGPAINQYTTIRASKWVRGFT